MRVVFVRHGKQIGTGSRETERDKWDPPLSTQGHQQAELLARHLAATEAGGAPGTRTVFYFRVVESFFHEKTRGPI